MSDNHLDDERSGREERRVDGNLRHPALPCIIRLIAKVWLAASEHILPPFPPNVALHGGLVNG